MQTKRTWVFLDKDFGGSQLLKCRRAGLAWLNILTRGFKLQLYLGRKINESYRVIFLLKHFQTYTHNTWYMD